MGRKAVSDGSKRGVHTWREPTLWVSSLAAGSPVMIDKMSRLNPGGESVPPLWLLFQMAWLGEWLTMAKS